MSRIKHAVVENASTYWKRNIVTVFLTFLSSKYAGLTPEQHMMIGAQEDRRFLEKFFIKDGKYYNPCTGNYLDKRYYTSIHQNRTRGGYSSAFVNHQRGVYSFSKHYIDITQENIRKKQSIEKISLTQVICWLYREEDIQEVPAIESLKKRFLTEFNITPKELISLFEDDLDKDADILDESFSTLIQNGRGDEVSPYAFDIEEPGKSRRNLSITYRIVRDTELARKIKRMYNFSCQICGNTIELKNGQRYAEAHHLQPLGSPHNGPDVEQNIICVCPNDHVLLDYGVLRINKENLKIKDGHEIREAYITYHNDFICQNG